MSKKFIFDKDNLINFAYNANVKFAHRIREYAAQGGNPYEIDKKTMRLWYSKIIDEELALGEVKIDELLDKVDEVLKEIGLGNSYEVAKKIRSETN